MNKKVPSSSEEKHPLRLALAATLLFSVGGCSISPTQKPFLPATPPETPANRPTTQTAVPKEVTKTPPRVTMSPIQALPRTPDTYSIPEPSKSDRPTGPANSVNSDGGSAVAKVRSSSSRIIPNLPKASLEPNQAAAATPADNRPTGTNPTSNRPSVAEDPSDSWQAVPEPALVRKIDIPPRDSAAVDLPKKDGPNTPSSNGPASIEVPLNQCWGQVTVAPATRKKSTQVVTSPGQTRYKISQARIRNEQLPVVVKEGSQSYKLEEPQYVEVTEKVKVQEEYKRLRVEPAVYETKEEQVLVESARIGLRPCAALGTRLVKSTSGSQPSAQCSYEIPARYRTVLTQKLVKPESITEEVVPAVYKTITKKVVAEQAKVTPIEIPPATVQMPFASVEAPSSATAEPVQAVTMKLEVVEHEIRAPQLTWNRVICERDLSPGLIEAMQSGLKREGWMQGNPDGKLGPQTYSAAKDFQRSKGIESEYITYQLLEWLGIGSRRSETSR